MRTTVLNLIILDESGSMSDVTRQTVSGCNETINTIKATQKELGETQEHFVNIYAFQSEGDRPSRYLIKGAHASEVEPITLEDYQPCGCTPLYDAVGATLADLKAKARQYEAAVGSVTIITDGMENSSREYSHAQVKQMIDELKAQGWNFNFIGANIDVECTAHSLGISNYLKFESSAESVERMFRHQSISQKRYMENIQSLMADDCDPRSFSEKMASASANFFGKDDERIASGRIRRLAPNEVFVFGSNLEGQHTGGAARTAVIRFGAVMGQGVGLQGQSYAIPTMQGGVDTIKPYVDEFIEFAKAHPDLKFLVTRIGCGIAGFSDSDIAPLFKDALDVENIYLPAEFVQELRK